MFVTITASSELTEEQADNVEGFLTTFLPRVRNEAGVLEILHGLSPGRDKAVTIIVWDGPDSLQRYREGDLIKEAIGFETDQGLSSTRDAFSVTQRLAGDHLIDKLAAERPI